MASLLTLFGSSAGAEPAAMVLLCGRSLALLWVLLGKFLLLSFLLAGFALGAVFLILLPAPSCLTCQSAMILPSSAYLTWCPLPSESYSASN
eukprot:6643026-Karenia_brevis.AAC.1